jgi:hypothetical protein
MTDAPEKMWVFPKEKDEIDEINKLRFKAFASNSADDLAAFREAAAKWFMNEATRALDRSYAQEAEADTLRAEVARLTAEIRVLKRDLFYCFPTEFEYKD